MNVPQPGQRLLPWLGPATWLRLFLLAVAYYGLAQVGLLLALPGTVASPAWPPAGLAVVAVAMWGPRAALAVVVAAFAVEIGAGLPPSWSAGMALGIGLGALVGGRLLARAGGPAMFGSLRGVAHFGLAAVLAALPSAVAGVVGLFGSGTIGSNELLQTAATWYLGDLVGIVVVAPPLLAFSIRPWPKASPREVLECGVIFATLAATAYVAFGLFNGPLVFLVVPPVVWMAIRFGPWPTSLALLMLDAAAIVGTQAGRGPFQGGPPGIALLILQAFMVVLTVFSLVLAALAQERRRDAANLEERVRERTAMLSREIAERRRAQAEAEEAQRVAQLGTWRWDITKPNADWSPELYRIYGLDPATHTPTYADYLTRVHPDDVERVKAATEAVFRDHKSYSHDERIRRPDGSWRHLHTWASAVLDAEGKLTALVGTCQDITSRVAEEAKFRDLLESAPDAMIIADAQGKIVLVNSRAESMFGYARKELLGQSIDMLVPDAVRGKHAQHRASYDHAPRARPMGAGLDLRARRKDGSQFPVEISLSPLETPEGRLVSSAIRDVTVQRENAQALRESLGRFRALADASPVGIVHTTPSGSVDYANQAWIGITGIQDYRDDALVTRSIHPEDQPAARKLWDECMVQGREFSTEMRWVRPNGDIRLTSCRAVPIRNQDGAVTGFVSAVQDITDLRAAADLKLKQREADIEVQRLREVAKFKTNFLRTAAHELGTPLTPIKIQLRILRQLLARRDAPEELKAATILDRNLGRLEVLVRDLLESARLESGRLRINARPMDLAQSIHDVVESFQEQAMERGIALDATVPNELPLHADPDRLTQVLYNLLSNAMKFTRRGGRVHVQAQALGEDLDVQVTDTGHGFTSEQAARLFQPFSQLQDPMQSTRAGSGLGLYICRGIIEQHGGHIEALSPGPGQGATFRFTIPRTAKPQEDVPATEAAGDEVPAATDDQTTVGDTPSSKRMGPLR